MLEYGQLTELDNDYITIMSDYLRYEVRDMVMSDIIKLAELGQINAIMTYYVLNGGYNEKIEKHIQKIIKDKPSNFNEAIALDAYFSSKITREEFKEIEGLIETYKGLKNDLYIHDEREGLVKDTQVEKKLNEILDKLLTYDLIKYRYMAIEILEGLTNTNEKMLEVKLELTNRSVIHKLLGNKVKESQVKKVRKALYAKLKSNPEDVATKFYLAKNIACFGGNKKEVELGKKILEDLSTRKLSIDLLQIDKDFIK